MKYQDNCEDLNVLVLGGLGMIGSTVAKKLVDAGASVTLVDACIEPYGANLVNVKEIEDRIKINYADIRDWESMKVLVRDRDVVFNFAGQVSHNDSLRNPQLDIDINYKGHVNVLEACRTNNPDARVLYAGSRLQFGRIERIPADESHPSRPLTPYGVNKQAAENYALYCSRLEPRLETVCFRIANPYGPRSQMKHSKYSMVNWFIRQAMDGKPLTVFGDGAQVRDYIFVDDLADAFCEAATHRFESDERGHVFNVGSGSPTRFIDLAQAVGRALGVEVQNVPWPADYKNVETGDYVTDTTKIMSVFDWSAKVGLEDGIARTIDFYTEHRDQYWD